MSAIAATFRELKQRSEGGLIAYVMAGDPTPKHTPKIVDALVAGGADIVELGMPFSDPIADGPTLQRAAGRALEAGTTPSKVFDLARAITRANEVPVVVMTYYNIVHQMGVEAFCSAAEQSGVNGVIAPDLPIEEASPYKVAAMRHGIDTIFLAAPSTSAARLEKLLTASSGFFVPCFSRDYWRAEALAGREHREYTTNRVNHSRESSNGGRIRPFVAFACPAGDRQRSERGHSREQIRADCRAESGRRT